MGAAGRDYHDFLTYFKDNNEFNVVAFTQAQIPGIEKRKFPKELAGKLYKNDIPFYPEKQLPELIKKFKVDIIYLAYSDLSHQDVMNKASLVLSNGADFGLLGPHTTYLKSKKPVISITAVRTGVGKSRIARKVAMYLKNKHYKVVVVRHPMPYGDLLKEEVQMFYRYEDLIKADITIEEHEEYDQYVRNNIPIFAGVNYSKILKEAEKYADIILWDGGNNDWSFFKPDLNIVLVDPRRVGHELTYYPGQVNLRMADIVLIHKMLGTTKENLKTLHENIRSVNKHSKVIEARSLILCDNPKQIKNKKVLLIGDGPTLTHGGMKYGIADAAAKLYHAKEIVDAEKYAIGTIKETYKKFSHLKKVLPAMGYNKQQICDLQKTINNAKCDLVLDGSPFDIKKLITINKKILYVDYDINDRDLHLLYNEIDKLLK
jgi:predicted GTPase